MPERNIHKLFDVDFVKSFFTENVLPHYPDFLEVIELSIIPHKKNIWEKSHHVVLEYRTRFLGRDGLIHELPIYCSTHSEESRLGMYESLRFLWDKGFDRGYLSIPHPLFFSEEFQGVFYRGVEGRNLYYYIRQNDRTEIESIVGKAAKWFAKLHRIPCSKNFNPKNGRIETVLPGLKHINQRMKQDYPEWAKPVAEIYDIINSKEIDFFSGTGKRWLVHGDAHPENVIRMSPRKLAVIDFTDLCLGDFARDLGSFTQQIEYMITRKLGDQAFADQMKDLFIRSYFEKTPERYDEAVADRIRNYYLWTAMRTASHFLIKYSPEPERAAPLIGMVRRHLGLN